MNDTTKENKMGVMPIPKLLITMSLPMVISMLVQALYNIIDSVFVAQINEEALTAVSLAFPVQNLMIAIATEPASESMLCYREISVKSGSRKPIWLRETESFSAY